MDWMSTTRIAEPTTEQHIEATGTHRFHVQGFIETPPSDIVRQAQEGAARTLAYIYMQLVPRDEHFLFCLVWVTQCYGQDAKPHTTPEPRNHQQGIAVLHQHM